MHDDVLDSGQFVKWKQWEHFTVQSHDCLVVHGPYIKTMKTLFHGWARKASDRRSSDQEARRREGDAEDIELGRKWERCPPPQPTMGSGNVVSSPGMSWSDRKRIWFTSLYCCEYVQAAAKRQLPMMSCCLRGAVKVLPLQGKWNMMSCWKTINGFS